jgi:hypothetical protein
MSMHLSLPHPRKHMMSVVGLPIPNRGRVNWGIVLPSVEELRYERRDYERVAQFRRRLIASSPPGVLLERFSRHAGIAEQASWPAAGMLLGRLEFL